MFYACMLMQCNAGNLINIRATLSVRIKIAYCMHCYTDGDGNDREVMLSPVTRGTFQG